MKVAESFLAILVVSLAAFVAAQASASEGRGDAEAAGIIAAAAADPEQTGSARSDGSEYDADDVTASSSGTAREARAGGDLRSGRAEGRLVTTGRYLPDVPRDAPWPAADMRRRLAQGEAGTYIGALLAARDSVITRWPDRRLTPLRVWVGEGGDQDGWNPVFPAVVRDAFEEWAATGIPVRFTYVRDSSGADVRVRFVPEFAQGISGRTIWSRDSAWWLVEGDVELAIRHPRGGPVSAMQLRAIALHEVGHLLGLDHVDDAEHIMAPRVRVRGLSNADVATMQLLYSVPAGPARD